jgi:predicted Zn-dependent protease
MNMRKLSPLALGLILNAACSSVQAATEADPVAPPSITVKAFRIVGSRAFSEAELLKLVENSAGQKLTRKELLALADNITRYYRRHGFPKAHAIIPQQNFAGGIVRFLITTQPVGGLTKPDQTHVPNQPPDFGNTPGDPVQVLLDRAKWCEDNDRLNFAQEFLDKLFSIVSNQPSGLAMQAQIDIRRNEPEAAQIALDELRRAQPDHPSIPRIEALLRSIGQDKAELRHARLLVKAAEATSLRIERVAHYEAAAAIFRKLYPNGPPSDDLTLEYWQIIANIPGGWYPAREGIAKLARDNPDNLRYRLALAEHETSRLPLKRQALQVIIDISKIPAYSKQARQAWRSAMMRLSDSPANLPLLRDYLIAEPNDSALHEKRDVIAHVREKHRRLMADPDYRAGNEGLALLEKGELDAAEPLLEQALRARPNDSELVGGMGLLRLRQGRHAEAQGYFAQAVHLKGENSKKWLSLTKVARFWQLMQEARTAHKEHDFGLAENRLNTALQLKPDDPNAIAMLASVQADSGSVTAAADTYRRALSIDPLNSEALEGLITLYHQQGMELEAQKTIAGLSAAQRIALGNSINTIEAGMLRGKADKMLANGQANEATAILEQAVKVDSDDAWLRLDLARLYARTGMEAKGQQLFIDHLAKHPNDTSALYALSLFQSGQGKDIAALNTLDHIAKAERTTNMSQLQRRLWISVQEKQATALVKTGQQSAARSILTKSETAAADDIDLTTSVAFQWAELGDVSHARELLDKIRNETIQKPVIWHLRYAEFLAKYGSETELQEELKKIASEKLSIPETDTLVALRESAALRFADEQIHNGKTEDAYRTLAPFLAVKPNDPRFLMVQARGLRVEKRFSAAENIYQSILKLSPKDNDARKELVDTYIQAGNRTQALAQMDEWNVQNSANDVDSRLALTGLLIDLGEFGRARKEIDLLLVTAPDNPKALAYAGEVARHYRHLDESIDYIQRSLSDNKTELDDHHTLRQLHRVASATTGEPMLIADPPSEDVAPGDGNNYQYKKLAEMLDERTAWLSSAADWLTRTGTPGQSMFNSLEIPVEWKTPWRSGDQLFFRADAVTINAGTLNLAPTSWATTTFGSQAVCQNQKNCPAVLTTQTAAQGTSFTAGYERENLRADVGTTPLGFPVWNFVGGILQKGDIGPFGYSLDVSRRPITSTLLSFAGTVDPRTGAVWGGVVATGARVGLSLDKGGTFGFWSSLGLHKLTGENVQSNDSMRLMTGGTWRIINEEDRLFSVGLTGTDWRFKQDSGEFTFGQGGYYSPQSYYSLSLPVTYEQRFSRLSYVMRASVFSSLATINASPYFPTNSAYQLQAGNPFYQTSSGPGNGYDIKAAWEYQMTPRLFIGNQLEIVRSPYYAPNSFIFYLRYALDHEAAQPVFLPPQSIIPTSQF